MSETSHEACLGLPDDKYNQKRDITVKYIA